MKQIITGLFIILSLSSCAQWTAKGLGIAGTGDKTAQLNSAFSIPTLNTLDIDVNQLYTISGTLNLQGKTVVLTNGAKFSGTATIINGYIENAGNVAILDTSVKLSTGIKNTVVSPDWWGANTTASALVNSTAFKRVTEFVNTVGGKLTVTLYHQGTYTCGVQDFAGSFGKNYSYHGWDMFAFRNVRNVTFDGNGATLKFVSGLKVGSYNPSTGVSYTPLETPFTNYDYHAQPGAMIKLDSCYSTTIKNVTLDGNLQGMTLGGSFGSGYEVGGLGIYATQNWGLTVDNVVCQYHTTDGMMVSNYVYTDSTSIYYTTISNSRFTGSGRQGFSWIGGNHLIVKNCEFSKSGRTINTGTGLAVVSAPSAGVDIEPETDNNGVPVLTTHGTFENCRFFNNEGVSLLIVGSSRSKNIDINNCIIENPRTWALWVAGELVSIKNSRIIGTVITPYSTASYSDIRRNRLVDCDFSMNPTEFTDTFESNSNTANSDFGDQYTYVERCRFNLFNHRTPSSANTEYVDCIFKDSTAFVSNTGGKFKGTNIFTYASTGKNSFTTYGTTPIYEGRTIIDGALIGPQNLNWADGIKIGSASPTIAPSAALDISSTTKGVLLPRVTSTQRNTIPAPANGLLVFNTTTAQFEYFNSNNSSWSSIGTSTDSVYFDAITHSGMGTLISPVVSFNFGNHNLSFTGNRTHNQRGFLETRDSVNTFQLNLISPAHGLVVTGGGTSFYVTHSQGIVAYPATNFDVSAGKSIYLNGGDSLISNLIKRLSSSRLKMQVIDTGTGRVGYTDFPVTGTFASILDEGGGDANNHDIQSVADLQMTGEFTNPVIHTDGDGLRIEDDKPIFGANELLYIGSPTIAPQYRLSALNTAPASATDTGITGEIRVTATFIYVCIATDTWVRSALSTW